MPTWNTAADWDSATSESGVAHENTGNTDHNDATIVKQGYKIANPYLSSNLVGYWPLHENSGSTAYDFSGNNNDGSINGSPTQGSTGILGTSAYDFDGADDHISLPDFGLFDGSTPYSLEAWVNVPSGASISSSRYDTLWSLRANYDVQVFSYSEYNANGKTQFKIWDGNNENYINGTDIRGNGWVHLVVTYDTNDGMKLYENSVSQGTSAFTGTPNNSSSSFTGTPNNSSIRNRFAYGQNDNFEGKAAFARIYNKTLSSSEIQTLYDVVNTNGTLTTDYRSG